MAQYSINRNSGRRPINRCTRITGPIIENQGVSDQGSTEQGNNEPKVFKCVICDPNKLFINKSGLSNHKRFKPHVGLNMIIRQTDNLFELMIDENPGQPEELVEPQNVNQHQCKDCPNSYPTAIGLGMHRKAAHPDEYNADIPVSKIQRFTEEEVRLIAKANKKLKTKNKQIEINLINK